MPYCRKSREPYAAVGHYANPDLVRRSLGRIIARTHPPSSPHLHSYTSVLSAFSALQPYLPTLFEAIAGPRNSARRLWACLLATQFILLSIVSSINRILMSKGREMKSQPAGSAAIQRLVQRDDHERRRRLQQLARPGCNPLARRCHARLLGPVLLHS